MVESVGPHPSLARLRKLFADGNVEGARSALLNLTEDARSELEARLGAPTVARMMQTARTRRSRIVGRVVVIHGIMGGKSASVDAKGDEDLIWINFLRLANGRLGRFTLDSEGSPADPAMQIKTCGLLDQYMPLVLELGNRWQVLPFAFDWRLDIDRSAAALDLAIRDWAGSDPYISSPIPWVDWYRGALSRCTGRRGKK